MIFFFQNVAKTQTSFFAFFAGKTSIWIISRPSRQLFQLEQVTLGTDENIAAWPDRGEGVVNWEGPQHILVKCHLKSEDNKKLRTNKET